MMCKQLIFCVKAATRHALKRNTLKIENALKRSAPIFNPYTFFVPRREATE
jgi:hypothetical protein